MNNLFRYYSTSAILLVIGVKRGKKKRKITGRFSGCKCVIKVGAALVTKLSGTYLCPADRRKSKQWQTTPTIAFLCSFACLVLFTRLFDTALEHTAEERLLGLGYVPRRLSLVLWSKSSARIGSSSLKQFLASARNCVFVRKFIAQRTELNLSQETFQII